MICYCPFSNTNYRTDNFKGRWKAPITQPHPIFFAPLDHLLQRSADLVANRLAPQEARLLFLALLNSTGGVTFEHPADPLTSTILQNSEGLVRFINWYDAVPTNDIILPRFVVRHANRALENVTHWLESLYDVKETWQQRKANKHLRDRLASKEAVLERLIKSTTRRESTYTLKLATWALQAAEVPPALYDYWMRLFLLSGLDLYKADFTLADFSELREHMENNLPVVMAPLYSHAVLHHVRKLEKIRERGLDYWLGLTDNETSGSLDATFQILDESRVEAHNISVAIHNFAPDSEPLASNYPNKVAFIRAKAAWTLYKNKEIAAAALVTAQLAAEHNEQLDNLAMIDEANAAAADDEQYIVETLALRSSGDTEGSDDHAN